MPTWFNTMIFFRVITFGMLLFANVAWAQTAAPDQPRWYQVEVAIFTQPANSQLVSGIETFRKDVTLAYRPGARYLKTAEAYFEAQQTPALPAQTVDGTLPLESAPTAPLAPSEQELAQILAHQPYIQLPEAERGLNDTIAALARRNRQRILFHQAWRQPVNETPQAIVVEGGDSFDQDTELSGQIGVGVSRYLHFDTDLWMASFAENFGQGDQGWPPLPVKPHLEKAQQEESAFNFMASQTFNGQGQDLWNQQVAIDNTYQSILTKPFVISELATLKQTRRMRSGEVHYIDHPKIGVMVLITPYEKPALEVTPESEPPSGLQ